MLAFLANPLGMLTIVISMFGLGVYFQTNIVEWSHNLIWLIIRIGDSLDALRDIG